MMPEDRRIFKIGSKVQWTDYVIKRNSREMTARTGKLIAIHGDLATVERRKQRYEVPVDELRNEHEDSDLTTYMKSLMK